MKDTWWCIVRYWTLFGLQ